MSPVINLAARIQDLAKPGEVYVNKLVVESSISDTYSFINVTDHQKDKIENLKGIPEDNIFIVKHKRFNSNWEKFCNI